MLKVQPSLSLQDVPYLYEINDNQIESATCIYEVMNIIIPPATKLGRYTGITMSVRLSSAFGFPAHNCFPFTPIIMKLHMQTPHESRMCPVDFEVKRSKVKVTMHKLLKMVSGT